MVEKYFNIRDREEVLKRKWAGISDHIPVNVSQYSFDTPDREEAFIQAQFPTEEEQRRYHWYREEWYRRAKEFDPSDFPLAVCCELVSSCNLGCSMCYTITDEFQDQVVGAQRKLPWKIVTAVIDECVELGVPSILFSWRGESTMYRARHGDKIYSFPDALAYARQKGILEITSLTHGQIIGEKMAEAIVDAEPSWISFSIDGLEKSYNKIRTPANKLGTNYNAFQTVVNNIKRLISIRDAKGKTRPQIRTNTIFPAIADNPQAYYDFLKNIGVGWLTINELLDFRGENLPENAIIENWACQYPFQRLTVAANGTILPCTGAHNEDENLVLGRYKGSAPKVVQRANGAKILIDVPEISLSEAWLCQKIQNIRQLHRQNRRKEIHPGCRNCRHGAKKHGVTWVPEEWDIEKMEWKGVSWRE